MYWCNFDVLKKRKEKKKEPWLPLYHLQKHFKNWRAVLHVELVLRFDEQTNVKVEYCSNINSCNETTHWLHNHHGWQLVSVASVISAFAEFGPGHICWVVDNTTCKYGWSLPSCAWKLWNCTSGKIESGAVALACSTGHTHQLTFAIALYSSQMGLRLWWIFAPLRRSIVINLVRMLKLGHVVVSLSRAGAFRQLWFGRHPTLLLFVPKWSIMKHHPEHVHYNWWRMLHIHTVSLCQLRWLFAFIRLGVYLSNHNWYMENSVTL